MAVGEINTQAAIEAHLGRGAARHAVGPMKFLAQIIRKFQIFNFRTPF